MNITKYDHDAECRTENHFSENSYLSSKYKNDERIWMPDTRDLPNVF